MSRILVFSGPTLAEEDIHEIAPHVEVYPPVAAGELLRLPLHAGDLVAIIDGYYFQAASVRHKEILDLLARGIHVWGAGSMGALRGAELAPFGMRGFGHVFHAYTQGDIDGDDEVALTHAPEEMDYLKLSEALVNIRYASKVALDEGVIGEQAYHAILDVACELPFFERIYPHICKLAQAHGLSVAESERFLSFVRQPRVDVKRLDALAMISALKDAPDSPFQPTFHLNYTRLLRNWQQDEQGIQVKDQWITYRELLTAYQLFGEDYPTVHFTTLATALVSDEQTTSRTQEQIIARFLEQQYGFRKDIGIPEVARRWLRPAEQNLAYEQQMTLLAVRLWHVQQGKSWLESMLHVVRAHPLFPMLLKVVYQARQYQSVLEQRQQGIYSEYLLPEKMNSWFQKRWQVAEDDFTYALLDRGFASQADFWQAARAFYLFDKYIGVDPLYAGELALA
jgi:hypothetical protein